MGVIAPWARSRLHDLERIVLKRRMGYEGHNLFPHFLELLRSRNRVNNPNEFRFKGPLRRFFLAEECRLKGTKDRIKSETAREVVYTRGRNEALAAAANSFFYDLSKELLTSASSSSAMPASLAEHLNELGLYHVVAPHFIGIVPAPVSSPNSIPQLNLGLGFGSREGFCGELELKKTSLPQTFSLEQEWIELTQLRLLLGRVPVQALSDLFEDPLFDGFGVGSLERRTRSFFMRALPLLDLEDEPLFPPLGDDWEKASAASETCGFERKKLKSYSQGHTRQVAKARRLIFLIRNLSIGGAQPSFKPQSPARDVKHFSMSSTRPVDPGGKGNPLIESIPDDAPLTITRPTYSPNATRLFRGMAFNPISIYAPPRPKGGLNPIPSSIPLSGKRTKRRARSKERANPIKNIWWIRIPDSHRNRNWCR
ncbi:hypothetical protein ACH5RR_018396 [Cinchona calisaya]|uniref:Ribosomal protein S3 n=1 Tax=Cinchona calisaya TaxID=153742 RepID=A0ABD2ZQ11_9GENT